MLCSVVWADLGDELIQAAHNNDLEEVERLLEAGADVNWQDEYGDTALYYAVMGGHISIVELLKAAGAVE